MQIAFKWCELHLIGGSWSFFVPELFPGSVFDMRNRYVLAPFWADHDARSTGSVQYQVFQCGFDSPDNAVLLFVSTFIRKQFPAAAVAEFLGTWMLVVNWIAVPPFGDPTVVSMMIC